MTQAPAAPEPPRGDGAAGMAELFRSPNLLVRRISGNGGDVAVVTFACLLETPDLEGPGFGETFLRERGIDAIHVTCASNDWYQYPELPSALACIRVAVRPYGRVLAYGSSMGGYAAVRHGGTAGAQAALAISPQFSIDVRVVPFERRWRPHAIRIRFLDEADTITIPEATIVYDPRDVDRRHVDLIAAAIPVRRIPLVHAGHPAGACLAETGLLPELLLACCRGEADPAFVRRARSARRRSGQYYLTLARSVARHRIGTKVALARRAAEAVPEEPVYHGYLALLLDHAGEIDAAAAAHRRALDLGPHLLPAIAGSARFLLRRGQATEGAALARALHAARPGDPKTLHLLGVALVMAGDLWLGLRILCRVRAWAVLWDGARLMAWRPTADGWTGRWTGRAIRRLALHLGVPDELRSADIVREQGALRRSP